MWLTTSKLSFLPVVIITRNEIGSKVVRYRSNAMFLNFSQLFYQKSKESARCKERLAQKHRLCFLPSLSLTYVDFNPKSCLVRYLEKVLNLRLNFWTGSPLVGSPAQLSKKVRQDGETLNVPHFSQTVGEPEHSLTSAKSKIQNVNN